MTFLKQILVPTDFSRNSSTALNYACDLAKESNSKLHLLHVVPGSLNGETDQVTHLEKIASMLDARQLEDLKEIFPTLLLFGDPAQLAPVNQSGEMVFDDLPVFNDVSHRPAP